MSEAVKMQDCGDGLRRADMGSAFNWEPIAKTADYTIKAQETGKCFSNEGATGTVVLTLPTPKPGMIFKFTKIVQDQILSVKAPSGVTINAGTANQVYKNATTETGYATLEVEAYSATQYVVRSETGTWANAAS